MRGYTKEHGNVIIKSWCDFGGYKQHRSPLQASIVEVKQETQSKNTKCPAKGGVYALHGECNYRFLNALDKLTIDANLTGRRPSNVDWVREILFTVDGYAVSGRKIDVRSQFYEVAKALLHRSCLRRLVAQNTVDMFKKIKHEQIIKAATFDLLFSEQDRHGQNVFVTEEGDIKLIDSERLFRFNALLVTSGRAKI